jgi:DHA1 family inner membrane transport protein
MPFFTNDAVNRVNLHTGVRALASGAGGAFFFVYLLRAGVPVPITLLAEAAMVFGRFSLRPLLLWPAKRFGVKPLFIAGAVLIACGYPILAEVHGVGGTLLLLCIVLAVADMTYWVAYNAYFAQVGDVEHRGSQIGAREALVALIGIVAPLLGAGALITAGPRWTFDGVALIQLASIVPLIGAPNVAVKAEAPGAWRAARVGGVLMVSDGWFDATYLTIWQIALFVTLKESFAAYGGALALAGLVGAACALFFGRHIDLGGGRRAVVATYGLATLIVLARAASFGFPWLAVGANALGALLIPLLSPTLGSALYNLAKASPCSFRFHLTTEGGWDVGCFFACLIAAAVAWAGGTLAIPILLALPAVGASAIVLRRYYATASVGPAEGLALRDPI